MISLNIFLVILLKMIKFLHNLISLKNVTLGTFYSTKMDVFADQQRLWPANGRHSLCCANNFNSNIICISLQNSLQH